MVSILVVKISILAGAPSLPSKGWPALAPENSVWSLLDARVRVGVRGGELQVNWAGSGEHVWLSGPTEISFEGHVEV